jgi:excisionase family DNA binding protein
MKVAETNELLGAREAAELLGVTRNTLWRLAHRGDIPSVKFSRARNSHRFFEREVIEALRRGGLGASSRAALVEARREPLFEHRPGEADRSWAETEARHRAAAHPLVRHRQRRG